MKRRKSLCCTYEKDAGFGRKRGRWSGIAFVGFG